MNRLKCHLLWPVVVLLLFIMPSYGWTVEPDVVIRHPGELPEVEDTDRPLLPKKVFLPNFESTSQREIDTFQARVSTTPIPERVTFNPDKEKRYRIIRGKLQITFGTVYFRDDRDRMFRSNINNAGFFSLGPIPVRRKGTFDLYYELTHKGIRVIYDDESELKPLTVKIGSIDLNKMQGKTHEFQIEFQEPWKKKAFDQFKQVINKREKTSSQSSKTLRLEFMGGLDEPKKRRDGNHRLFPRKN